MTVLDDLEGFDAYWSGVKYNVLQLGFVFFFFPSFFGWVYVFWGGKLVDAYFILWVITHYDFILLL